MLFSAVLSMTIFALRTILKRVFTWEQTRLQQQQAQIEEGAGSQVARM